RALAPDQPASLQISDDHGHVAAAPENPLAEVALAHGAKVEQRLQHAELARGQAPTLEAEREPVPQAVARTGPLEVRAERLALGLVLAITTWLRHRRAPRRIA